MKDWERGYNFATLLATFILVHNLTVCTVLDPRMNTGIVSASSQWTATGTDSKLQSCLSWSEIKCITDLTANTLRSAWMLWMRLANLAVPPASGCLGSYRLQPCFLHTQISNLFWSRAEPINLHYFNCSGWSPHDNSPGCEPLYVENIISLAAIHYSMATPLFIWSHSMQKFEQQGNWYYWSGHSAERICNK